MYVRFFMAYERSIGAGSPAAEQEVRAGLEAEATGSAAAPSGGETASSSSSGAAVEMVTIREGTGSDAASAKAHGAPPARPAAGRAEPEVVELEV